MSNNAYIRNGDFYRNDAQFTFDHDRVGSWLGDRAYFVGDVVKNIASDSKPYFFECIVENGSALTGSLDVEPGVDVGWETYWEQLKDYVLLNVNDTTSIDLSTYIHNLVIVANKATNFTITFSNYLTTGRKVTVIGKGAGIVTLSGTINDAVFQNEVRVHITDGSTFYNRNVEPIRIDTIQERTTDNGVDIEGVNLKDSAVNVDTISEQTTDNGVDIEGVNLKDNAVNVDTINEQTTNNGVDIDGVNLKDNAVNVDTINEQTTNNGVDIESVKIKDGAFPNGINTDTISEETGANGVDIDGVKLKDGGVQTDGTLLKQKIVNIGDWNMDSNVTVFVTHTISDYKKIRNVSITIRNDSDSIYYNLNNYNSNGSMSGGVSSIDSTQIILSRTTGSIFDDPIFDSTSYNRGWLLITYEI
jgi:hypothetical protein